CKNCYIFILSKKDRTGKNNNNYKDGRTTINKKCLDCNKPIYFRAIRCKSCSKLGRNNNNYIDGRKNLKRGIRGLKEYSKWRTSVYKRDNYTCKQCGQQGNKLEADHIK